MKKAIITKDIRKQGKVDVGVALDGHPVGTAVGDSDGGQLRHCDVCEHWSATRLKSTSVLRWVHSSVTRRRAGSETRWEHWSETRTDPSSALHLASKMAGS